MKNHRLEKSAASLLLLGLLLAFAGCATSGYRTNERTAKTLDSLANRIELAGAQMDIAVTELNNLVNNPQPDLRPQFNRFSAAVNKLESLASSVQKADTDLQARGKTHFESWDKEVTTIQNEVIRSNAQARKLEVLGRFNNLRNNCLTVLTGYSPVQSDLRDTQRFLNSDLTLGGLAAIKDTASRVTQQATPVRDSVSKLVAEMKSVAVAVSPHNGVTAVSTNSPSK